MADTGAEDTTTRPVVILGMFVKQKTDLVLLIGFWLRPVVLSAGFLALSGASCDPCVQLTNSICDCEPTANAQIACRQERELQRSQRDESTADQEICARALETCTCAAMENNDWEACGMSRDTVPDTENVSSGADEE